MKQTKKATTLNLQTIKEQNQLRNSLITDLKASQARQKSTISVETERLLLKPEKLKEYLKVQNLHMKMKYLYQREHSTQK